MSEEPIEPFDPALASLLDSVRRERAPTEALGRVWSRVAIAPVGLQAAHSPTHGWLANHVAGVAAVAFVAGGGVGVVVHAGMEKPRAPQIVYVERPAAPLPPSPTAFVEAPSSLAPVASSAAPVRSPRPAPSTSSTLAAERMLVDRARQELSEGNGDRALSLLDEHPKRFPKAQLGEERDALVVQSLVTLGRYDEARAAAARFKAASPQSLFLPAIEATLGSIP